MRPSLFKGGDESVITGTRIHPVWSLDQNAWVELGHLEVGETLLGADGPTKVQCLTFLSANQPVYNLEVFGEHVYRVGNWVFCVIIRGMGRLHVRAQTSSPKVDSDLSTH